MALRTKLVEEYLLAMKDVKNVLLSFGVQLFSFEEKGFAYFVALKSENTLVDFLCGPSDWDTEMIIRTPKGSFAFTDLLQIPAIANRVESNRYSQVGGRNLRNELLWDIELLKFSLPLIE